MRKQQINIRINPDALEWIEAKAAEHGVARPVVLRALLAVGTAHVKEVDAILAKAREVQ